MTERTETRESGTGPIRLAHLSDIHFGKISHPGIVEALVDEINEAGVDLVVVSGDLTQRATDEQYRAAKAMLDSFDAPVLVVPGNHDVRQFWHNPIERVIDPTARFERWITNDLMPSFSINGLSVFGMNTAHGLTVKNGLVRKAALEAMQTYFDSRPVDDFRILAVHHHLIKNKAVFGRTDVAIGASSALKAAEATLVDLILCGHYHIPSVNSYPLPGGREIVVAGAGTATSSRGRGEHKAINMYNRILVDRSSFSIEVRTFDISTARFLAERTTTFDRS